MKEQGESVSIWCKSKEKVFQFYAIERGKSFCICRLGKIGHIWDQFGGYPVDTPTPSWKHVFGWFCQKHIFRGFYDFYDLWDVYKWAEMSSTPYKKH